MTQMNLSTKQKQTQKQDRFVIAKWEDSGEGRDWEFGISRCKLLYIEWVNKVLLYSTGKLYSISCDKPQWKRI